MIIVYDSENLQKTKKSFKTI